MGLSADIVTENFFKISEFPRASGNEEAVSIFISNYAATLGLYSYRDSYNNVYVRKKGKINGPTILFQGHLDMVCDKEKNSDFNFDTDKISIHEEKGWLKARGTTLGADNGIGISVALAIMRDEKLIHPDINFLFTTDEEDGLTGVCNIDEKLLNADYIINLDTLPEGYFYCGGAGGFTLINKIPLEYYSIKDLTLEYCRIRIGGLSGGHGHLDAGKERKNAIFVLNRVYRLLTERIQFHVGSISGGEDITLIPQTAEMSIALNYKDVAVAAGILKEIGTKLKKEYKKTDPGLQIVLESSKTFSKAVNRLSLNKLDVLLRGLASAKPLRVPNKNYLSFVANLGEIRINDSGIIAESFIAALTEELIEKKIKEYQDFSLNNKIVIDIIERVPVWKYKDDSYLTDILLTSYFETTGKEPIKTVIETICECGILNEKYGRNTDIVSFGFDIENIHTAKERVRIKSIENVVNTLKLFFDKINNRKYEYVN